MELNTYVIVWLVLFVYFIIAELSSLGLTSIWFAAGAFITMFAASFGAGIWVQIGIFTVISIVLLLCTRPMAMKYINKKMTKTNVDSYEGEVGLVTEDIDNLKAQGSVFLNGLDWTARSISDDVIIHKGTKVVVSKVEGVKLIVAPQA